MSFHWEVVNAINLGGSLFPTAVSRVDWRPGGLLTANGRTVLPTAVKLVERPRLPIRAVTADKVKVCYWGLYLYLVLGGAAAGVIGVQGGVSGAARLEPEDLSPRTTLRPPVAPRPVQLGADLAVQEAEEYGDKEALQQTHR